MAKRMIHPHDEILLSNKKGQIMDTRSNMNESQKHCPKQKKPNPKIYTMGYYFCEMLEKVN